MFTGIIEKTGVIRQISAAGTNKTFWIQSPISELLTIDQSISHDGVCLTVEEIKDDTHRVTAIEETLKKTNLDSWQVNGIVNLERCMQMNGRLDGHIVQGHVDSTCTCTKIDVKEGSWEYTFDLPAMFAPFVIEKGSISINGISLTLFNVTDVSFQVGIIPYTYNHTNLRYLKEGGVVNIEFDVIGKYVNRQLQFK